MQPLYYPPAIFARLSPHEYFQRHMEQGVRPSGNTRGFNERRTLTFSEDPERQAVTGRSAEDSAVAYVTGINLTDVKERAGVYCNVEISRGGFGAPPSKEEMVSSQEIHEAVRAIYAQQNEQNSREGLFEVSGIPDGKRKMYYVVTVACIVLSKNGEISELAFECVKRVLALVKLPAVELDDEGHYSTDVNGESRSIALAKDVVVRSGGVYGDKAILDLEGVVELTQVKDRVRVIKKSNDDVFYGISLAINDNNVIDSRKKLEKLLDQFA